MDEAQQAVPWRAGLGGLAGGIARGWADKWGGGKDALEWVAARGPARAPISAEAPLHWLDGDAGVAFGLAAPGVTDLLFVVRGRGGAYQVSLSNNARPWEPGE